MTRVSPDADLKDDSKKQPPPQEHTHPAAKVTGPSTIENVEVGSTTDYEKDGAGGVKEVLGNYKRISVITCILFINVTLIGLSAVSLLMTELSDMHWQDIVAGRKPFPSLKAHGTDNTYFENKKLADTPIGRLILYRKNWVKDNVDFGMDRETGVHLTQLIIMFAALAFCVLHLISACFFKRIRRNFQLISLGYGFVGLFVFTLCLTTLYFAFVHKVSAYIVNAVFPPTDFSPTPDNITINYYVNMNFACAFAFSYPNRFAKDKYPTWPPFSEDASFTIENVTYTKDEMMELGICPRQDYLLISVFLLAVTTAFCWLAASYSENLENEIIGPPIWLQRFKLKVHRGIRHWQTRSRIPSALRAHQSDSDEQDHHKYHRSLSQIIQHYEQHSSPTWDDAYDILDGGTDHILLRDPFNNKKAASSHRLYRSTTDLRVLDR